jgi:hypothetical protein
LQLLLFGGQGLACYAKGVDVDWSNSIGAAGPRGIAAINYRGEILHDDDPRMFDPRSDAQEAILHAVDHCE